MNWIFVAVLVPALYALGNYLDKVLLSKKMNSGGVGAIVLFSCLLGSLTIPIIFLIDNSVFSIGSIPKIFLTINGILTIVAMALYLVAIRDSDVSVVVPILQITPVFGFILGFLFLGESLTTFQLLGSVLIVLGALFLSLEISDSGQWKIKLRALILVCASALVFALSGVIFKFFAIDNGYWVTQFWEYVGIALTGILLFLFVPKYRNNFLSLFINKRVGAIKLNFITEIIMVTADLVMNFATLLAPMVLVYVVNSFQPAFVLIYGVIISLLLPKLVKEQMTKGHLFYKTSIIAVMVLGSIMLIY